MPKKILVIDDAPYIQKFSEALSEKGYLIFSTTLERNIPDFIYEEKPDLVIIDAFYHYASVLNTLNYLIEHNIPFLLFSDDEHIEELIKPQTLGALSFLIKPITDKQITLAVETTLYWHKERVQLERRRDNLNTTVDNNRKISVAIGMLMERYQLGNAEAFESLRKTARDQQCRILDVAIKLTDTFESNLSKFPSSGCMNPINSTSIKEEVLFQLKALLAE